MPELHLRPQAAKDLRRITVASPELLAAIADGRTDECLPFTGQTAGLSGTSDRLAEITTVLAEAHTALIDTAGRIVPDHNSRRMH